ncbi:hypothetical protein D9M68_290910 [compost metagenome]
MRFRSGSTKTSRVAGSPASERCHELPPARRDRPVRRALPRADAAVPGAGGGQRAAVPGETVAAEGGRHGGAGSGEPGRWLFFDERLHGCPDAGRAGRAEQRLRSGRKRPDPGCAPWRGRRGWRRSPISHHRFERGGGRRGGGGDAAGSGQPGAQPGGDVPRFRAVRDGGPACGGRRPEQHGGQLQRWQRAAAARLGAIAAAGAGARWGARRQCRAGWRGVHRHRLGQCGPARLPAGAAGAGGRRHARPVARQPHRRAALCRGRRQPPAQRGRARQRPGRGPPGEYRQRRGDPGRGARHRCGDAPGSAAEQRQPVRAAAGRRHRGEWTARRRPAVADTRHRPGGRSAADHRSAALRRGVAWHRPGQRAMANLGAYRPTGTGAETQTATAWTSHAQRYAGGCPGGPGPAHRSGPGAGRPRTDRMRQSAAGGDRRGHAYRQRAPDFHGLVVKAGIDPADGAWLADHQGGHRHE